MFKLEVVQKDCFGYDAQANSWTCPLCDECKVQANLDVSWVVTEARKHLAINHLVTPSFTEVSVINDKLYQVVVCLSGTRITKTLNVIPRSLNVVLELGGAWACGFPEDIVMLLEE